MRPLKHREAVLPEVAQHVNGRAGVSPGSVTLEPTPWWSQDSSAAGGSPQALWRCPSEDIVISAANRQHQTPDALTHADALDLPSNNVIK